jgi:hypothetical protein
MKMSKVIDIFDVRYGLNLELNALEKDKNGINFVSRTRKNNGVSAKVKVCKDTDPIPAGTISVAAGGASVVESFLQLSPYYSGRDLYYLAPKIPLSTQVKLYYCICIKNNRFRFSYGRQANSTLENLSIPSLEEIPQWAKEFSIEKYAMQLLSALKLEMDVSVSQGEANGNLVPLNELFTPVNGVAASDLQRFSTKIDDSYVPYIRPSYRQSTSFEAYISKESVDPKHVFPKDTLYVSTNGQGSHTFAYVSTFEFIPNSDVCVLIPKRTMSLQEKLYYADCIADNRYKFSYGRKPKGDRLESIMLPEYPPDFVANYDFSNVLNKFYPIIEELWGHN